MDRDLLRALSEADAIAASEQEVRDILLSEAQKYHKEVQRSEEHTSELQSPS